MLAHLRFSRGSVLCDYGRAIGSSQVGAQLTSQPDGHSVGPAEACLDHVLSTGPGSIDRSGRHRCKFPSFYGNYD